MCVFLEVGQSDRTSISEACLHAAEVAVATWVGEAKICFVHEGRLSVHLCDLLEYQNEDVPEAWLLDDVGSIVLGDAVLAALPLLRLPVEVTAMWDGESAVGEESIAPIDLLAAIRSGRIGNRVRYVVSEPMRPATAL